MDASAIANLVGRVLPGLLAILGLALVGWLASRGSRARRHRLAHAAARRQWQFHAKDPWEIPKRLASRYPIQPANVWDQASGTARHVLHGRIEGMEVTLFEYEEHLRARDIVMLRVPFLWPFFVWRRGRKTRPTLHTVAVMETPLVSPGLRIVPQRLSHNLSPRARRADINLESSAFSRRYYVSSRDRRFAYDILHPRAMQAMMHLPRMAWDWSGHFIVASKRGHLDTPRLRTMLKAVLLVHQHAPRHRISEQGRWVPVAVTPSVGSPARAAAPQAVDGGVRFTLSGQP